MSNQYLNFLTILRPCHPYGYTPPLLFHRPMFAQHALKALSLVAPQITGAAAVELAGAGWREVLAAQAIAADEIRVDTRRVIAWLLHRNIAGALPDEKIGSGQWRTCMTVQACALLKRHLE